MEEKKKNVKRKSTNTKKRSNTSLKTNSKPKKQNNTTKEPKKVETKKQSVKEVKKVEIPTKQKEGIDELFKLKIFALVLAVLLVVLLSFKNFINLDDINTDKKYKNDNYQSSYLVNSGVTSVSCDELYSATTGEKSFIYVTTLGSEEEYKLEKKLKNIIDDYNLSDSFYVYNLNDNCREVALNSMQLTNDFKKVPMIAFYRDGILQEQIARDDNEMLSDADLVKVLDIYEIKK